MAVSRVPDDKTLVEMIRNNDRSALGIIKQKYGRLIFTVCFNILRKKEDSEECENDVFLKAWKDLPGKAPGDLKNISPSARGRRR